METSSVNNVPRTYEPSWKGQNAGNAPDKSIADIIAEKMTEKEDVDSWEENKKQEEEWDREFEEWRRECKRQQKLDEEEYQERRRINKLRLQKYIKKQQEKKRLQREALEKAVECEQLDHQKKLSEYWKKKLETGDAPPGMLARRKIPPKAVTSSYETSFLIKDPKG